MAKELKDFDEEGFQFAMAKIRTCVIRGEMQQAHKVLDEFMPQGEVLSYSTSVYEIGLNSIVAGLLDCAGYCTLGSLAGATGEEIAKDRRIGPAWEAEILAAVKAAKLKIPK